MVAELKPFFIEHGLHLVGLDLIGSYITEINITSPTGFVQLNQQFNISIEDQYLDCLEKLKGSVYFQWRGVSRFTNILRLDRN
jgi:glutathione synthase